MSGEGGAQSAPGEGLVPAQFELGEQIFQNRISSLQDVIVPIPEGLKSLGCQDGIAPFIRFRIRVLAAIDFNDQTPLKANEIQDIISERDLATELQF